MKNYLILLILGLASTHLFAQSNNPPSTLAAVAQSSTQIKLTWKDNSVDETGFEIAISTDGRTFSKTGDAGQNATTYTSTGLTPSKRYYYQVRAVLPRNTFTLYSNTADALTLDVPPVANDLSTIVKSTVSIELRWSTSGKEPLYYVERRAGQTGRFERIGTGSGSYVDNGLTPGQEYCYRVQYGESVETAGYSNISCKTTPIPPTNIKNLKAQAQGSTSIKLTWDRFGKESPITIQRSIGQNGTWTNLANTLADGGEYTDNTAQPGTEYCYRIAEDGHEVSAKACDTTPAAVPITPTGLTVLSISTDQLQVFWTDANVIPVTFEISRSDKLGGNYTVIQPNYGSKIYDDKTLSASTQYCYRVRARNGSTYSTYSLEVCGNTKTPVPTAPRPPGNLTITNVSSDKIDLHWTDNSDNETGFQVERADSPTAVFQKIKDLDVNATDFSDQTVQPTKQYCYRVQAINGVGPSGYIETNARQHRLPRRAFRPT